MIPNEMDYESATRLSKRIYIMRRYFLQLTIAALFVASTAHAANDILITVNHRYLHLPIKNGAKLCWMTLKSQGRPALEFQIELAEDQPDYWAFLDVSDRKGSKLAIEVDRLAPDSKGLAAITQSDAVPDAKTLYTEKWRPQFHFTSRRGWLNDPNGLVYYDGQYHLFYQHNPYGIKWGNMTWGHAVSPDLVHWRELSDALHPDELGSIFSGSAVVDHNNTAGFQTGTEKPIIYFYTSAGGCIRKKVPFTQSIAYSNDSGLTFTKYNENPVLGHIVNGNRDPKVIWHQPSKRWIMALFLDKRDFALFSSPDLKKWTRLCDIPEFGDRECPDFFELPVDRDANNTRWVFWGASGRYLLGTFDGKSFTSQSGPHVAQYGPDDYAAQTYSDIPATDGRRIQIAWLRNGRYPDMPFNQQMSVPRVLSLRTTPDGVRLFIEPVEELKKLRHKEHTWKDITFHENPKRLKNLAGENFGDLLDIEVAIEPGKAKTVGIDIRGFKIEYSPAEKRLTAKGKSAPLEPVGDVNQIGGRITLRILVDRTSVEIFANSGRVQMASCFLPNDENKDINVYSSGGKARIESLKIWELESTWTGGRNSR